MQPQTIWLYILSYKKNINRLPFSGISTGGCLHVSAHFWSTEKFDETRFAREV